MTVIDGLLRPEFTEATMATSFRSVNFLLRRVLGVTLELKLLGANLVILAVAATALWGPLLNLRPGEAEYIYVVVATLAAGVIANVLLVRLALRPVAELQQVATRVASGRLGDRVPPSVLADPGLAQLATTMNEMLDNLAAGRERMKKLGAEVVYAQESERAQVARDLHDTVGQTLSAAIFQVAAIANELQENSVAAPRLGDVKELLRTALEEIRNVSRSLHPRVADDLGLPAALESLARATRARSLIHVTVITDIAEVDLSSALRGTLYTIAQQALREVEKHADTAAVNVFLYARPGIVELEVTADGSGLTPSDTISGLDLIRERLALAGGELRVDSTPLGGTRVCATIRMEVEAV